MILKEILIFSVMSWNLYNYAHEFHVTLTNLEYSDTDSTYQISMKVFTDDLELGLKNSNFSEKLNDSTSDTSLLEESIKTYVLQYFKLYDNENKEVILNYVGSETELDVTWVYLESKKVAREDNLFVENRVLNEIYDDQSHIVNFHYQNETSTVLLNKSRPKSKLE